MSSMPGRTGRRRLRPSAIAALLLLVAPIIEISAIVGVSQVIGGWWTFVLLVAMSILGAWLIRREGSRAWRALADALRSGRMPARELADGMLVLVGGTLLLTPGFITDAVGLLLVLPVTRPVMRGLLEQVIRRRLLVASPFMPPGAGGPGPSTASRTVIEGEIVTDPAEQPKDPRRDG